MGVQLDQNTEGCGAAIFVFDSPADKKRAAEDKNGEKIRGEMR